MALVSIGAYGVIAEQEARLAKQDEVPCSGTLCSQKQGQPESRGQPEAGGQPEADGPSGGPLSGPCLSRALHADG